MTGDATFEDGRKAPLYLGALDHLRSVQQRDI